jgi:hypothetical protein
MYETVTVDEAISRGRRMITFPVMGIMFGLIGLSVYLSSEDIIPALYMVIGIAAGVLLGWVYWSFMITKWKLWAFENVRNVHDLQRKAVEAQLIWNEGSFWEKTEIRNQADKDKWASLQNKFNQQDVFTEDLSVPQETTIYYSKGAIMVQIVVMLFCLGFGIYLFIMKSYIAAALLCAFAGYFIYTEYKRAINRDVQIILNDKGIQTVSAGFIDWKDIENEEVITVSSGKSSHTYLQYDYPEGSEKVEIGELDTNKKTLESLLHTYRLRSEKKVNR